MKLLVPFPQVGPFIDDGKRDLALDGVRSWSLVVVVLGHFLMQIQSWQPDGIPVASNTLASGRPWPFVTWLLQVMPLFFIAGGAVNRGSWERRRGSYDEWLWQRVSRLMRPTVPFLAVMAVVFTVLTLTVDRAITDPLVGGVTGPLWFLAVYIPVTSLTPVTLTFYKRHGAWSIVILASATLVVDVLRFRAGSGYGNLNVALAWILAHQLGYRFADGVRPRVGGWIAVVALAFNIVLTQVVRAYPTSLVGIPSEPFSNINPPDAALVVHIFFLFGLFVALAPWLRRVFARPRPYQLTAKAGLVAMTLYLWHMAVLVAWLSFLHFVGLDLPTTWLGRNLVVPAGPAYWYWLVPSTAIYGLLVYGVVRVCWPLEISKLPGYDSPPRRPPRVRVPPAIPVALLFYGLLSVAGASMSGFPLAVKTAFGMPMSALAGVVAIGLGIEFLRRRGIRASVPSAAG